MSIYIYIYKDQCAAHWYMCDKMCVHKHNLLFTYVLSWPHSMCCALLPKSGDMLWQAAPRMVKVGKLHLPTGEYNKWRGKFNRFMARKPSSGKLEVPEDLHRTWLTKSIEKDDLFESYIKCDGNKVWLFIHVRTVLAKKT